MDYLVELVLIAAPWLLGFADGGPAQWVPVILGASTILYSLLTQYELGLLKVIPMPVHLAIDFMWGVFLLASPWIFAFSETAYLPHVIVGAGEILIVLMSSARAGEHARRHTERTSPGMS